MDFSKDLTRQHDEFVRSGGFSGVRTSHRPAVTVRELQRRRRRRESNRTLRVLSQFWQPHVDPVRRMTSVHPVRSLQTASLESLRGFGNA